MTGKRRSRPLQPLLVIAALALAMALPGRAQQVGSPTDGAAWSALHLTEPTEIPGGVLEPGDYVVRLVRNAHGRTVVDILSSDETRIHARLLTLTTPRQEPASRAEFTFVPTGSGKARRALSAWTILGSSSGQEFIYPSDRQEAFLMAASIKGQITQSQGPEQEVSAGLGPVEVGALEQESQIMADLPPSNPFSSPITQPQSNELIARNIGGESRIASSLTSAPTAMSSQQLTPAATPTSLPRSASTTPTLVLGGVLLLLLGAVGLGLAWLRGQQS